MTTFSKTLAAMAVLGFIGMGSIVRAEDKAEKADAKSDAVKTDKTAAKTDTATDAKAADAAGDAKVAGEKKTGEQKTGDKKDGDKAAKAKGLKGTVVKVDGLAVTVTTIGPDKVAKETLVTTDDKTIVVLDGKPGALADLKTGQKVTIMPETGTPTKIEGHSAHAKGEKKPGDAEAAGEKKPGDKKVKEPKAGDVKEKAADEKSEKSEK